uniref:Uncharacterized protein n=1 Tax=Leersia perrieri TaxID=77586 RepID=A0A0D9WE70_9ORYZ
MANIVAKHGRLVGCFSCGKRSEGFLSMARVCDDSDFTFVPAKTNAGALTLKQVADQPGTKKVHHLTKRVVSKPKIRRSPRVKAKPKEAEASSSQPANTKRKREEGERKKKFVSNAGFEKLLCLQPCSVPIRLTLWLIQHVNTKMGTLEVCGKSIPVKALIEKVIGAPKGQSSVETSKEADTTVKLKFSENGREMPIPAAIDRMLKEETEDEFIVSFMLVALSIFLCPGSKIAINRDYIPAVQNWKVIKDTNWCDHIAIVLMDGIIDFKVSATKNVNIKGCVHILNVIFIDFVSTISVPHGTPHIGHVTTNHINVVLSKSINADFASLLLRDFEATIYAEGSTGQEEPAERDDSIPVDVANSDMQDKNAEAEQHGDGPNIETTSHAPPPSSRADNWHSQARHGGFRDTRTGSYEVAAHNLMEEVVNIGVSTARDACTSHQEEAEEVLSARLSQIGLHINEQQPHEHEPAIHHHDSSLHPPFDATKEGDSINSNGKDATTGNNGDKGDANTKDSEGDQGCTLTEDKTIGMSSFNDTSIGTPWRDAIVVEDSPPHSRPSDLKLPELTEPIDGGECFPDTGSVPSTSKHRAKRCKSSHASVDAIAGLRKGTQIK